MKELVYRIQLFFIRISRVLSIIPIAWKSEDWDYAYIDDLLIWKLTRLADHIEKQHRHIGCERDVKRIRIVICLLKRQDETIMTPRHSQLLDKWCETGLFAETGKGGLTASERRELTALGKLRIKKGEEEWNMIWDYIKKYSRGWWD